MQTYPNGGFSKESFANIVRHINFFAIIAFTIFKFTAGRIFDVAINASGGLKDLFDLLIVLGFFALAFTLFAQLVYALVSKKLLIILGVILTLASFLVIQKPVDCIRIQGVNTKVHEMIIEKGWPVKSDECENGFGAGWALLADSVVFILFLDQIDFVYEQVNKYFPYFKKV